MTPKGQTKIQAQKWSIYQICTLSLLSQKNSSKVQKTALKIKTILPVAHSLDSAFNRDNSPCTLGTNVQIVSDSSRCDLQNLIGGLLQSKK